jgi:hypothetical protein
MLPPAGKGQRSSIGFVGYSFPSTGWMNILPTNTIDKPNINAFLHITIPSFQDPVRMYKNLFCRRLNECPSTISGTLTVSSLEGYHPLFAYFGSLIGLILHFSPGQTLINN